MIKTSQSIFIAFVLSVIVSFSNASFAGEPHVNASDVEWIVPSESYSGSEFAQAFRYKMLIGDQYAPVQARDVYFGEAEFAPGAIYVGHKARVTRNILRCQR